MEDNAEGSFLDRDTWAEVMEISEGLGDRD
jgi:hypothetical protein